MHGKVLNSCQLTVSVLKNATIQSYIHRILLDGEYMMCVTEMLPFSKSRQCARIQSFPLLQSSQQKRYNHQQGILS